MVTLKDLRRAAETMWHRDGCAALLIYKGRHLECTCQRAVLIEALDAAEKHLHKVKLQQQVVLSLSHQDQEHWCAAIDAERMLYDFLNADEKGDDDA